MSATDILVHRTVASARGEGLPEPIAVALDCARHQPDLLVHLHSAEDSQRWVEWFTRHGADGWDEATDAEETPPFTHHLMCGTWRGWSVRLVYLTKPDAAEDGGSR